MSLRVRLALLFALVALSTGAITALTAPSIIGGGFAQIESDDAAASPGPGAGRGPGSQGAAGAHAAQVQQETTRTIVLVAVVAAAGASVLGLFLASRIARPLDQLREVAEAVAHGQLARRSGVGARTDEIGSLGRSFDAMAASLEDADAARRRFFQDAAHELKTPLAVITATTNAVLDGVYEHDDRHLETIRDQARLLARLVDDLRTIGLAEAGNLPLRPEPVEVGALLEDARRGFAARAEEARVALATEGGDGVLVQGDRDRLRQVLAALVDNALRMTPPGGRVTLEGGARDRTRPSDAIRIVVRDTGPGIPTEHLPHLFERFYQADSARDRSSRTSGLGLAIVRALVEAHGGQVGAENAAGGGARFWIELPAG